MKFTYSQSKKDIGEDDLFKLFRVSLHEAFLTCFLELPNGQHTPQDFDNDNWLSTAMEKLQKVWAINSEASQRTAIDTVILAVLSHPKFLDLKVFPEIKLPYRNSSTNYSIDGSVDYLISKRPQNLISQPMLDSFVVAVETKKYDSSLKGKLLIQAIAQGSALYRIRSDKRTSSSPVYVIFTNFDDWRFIRISSQGIVQQTDRYIWTKEKTTIIDWLFYIFGKALKMSPSNSVESLPGAISSIENVTDSLYRANLNENESDDEESEEE
jgi:hypothetical protein